MATVTREQLQSIEWVGAGRTCPCCGGAPRFTNHAPDCWLAAALAYPPAEDAAAVYRAVLEGAGYERLDDLPARGVEFARMLGETARMHTLALMVPQAPPASDPPGLVANWRPIETAPKRTDVLAGWADRPHWLPQVLQQDDAGMWFNGEESDYRPPTHWMPLPAAPQAETKGDE